MMVRVKSTLTKEHSRRAGIQCPICARVTPLALLMLAGAIHHPIGYCIMVNRIRKDLIIDIEVFIFTRPLVRHPDLGQSVVWWTDG